MKKTICSIFFLSQLFFFFACTKSMVEGNWKSVNQVETKDSVATLITQMQLLADGTYTYQISDGYYEKGVYRVDGHFFFTQDTLNKKQEKMVIIARVTAEELVLKMQNIKKEQIETTFIKIK